LSSCWSRTSRARRRSEIKCVTLRSTASADAGCPSFSLAIDKSQAARDVNPKTPVDSEAESVDLDPLYQPFLQVGNRLADSPSNRMVERRI